MKKGERVQFGGRKGTVVGSMPNGMIDIKFDDSSAVERRSVGRLAKANGSNIRLFTKADPARTNRARDAYCGNAIDGTAYYIFLGTQPTKNAPYVTVEDVRADLEEGLSPDEAVEAYAARRQAKAGDGVRVTVFKQKVSRSRKAEQTYRAKGKSKKKWSRIEDMPELYDRKGPAKPAPRGALVEKSPKGEFHYRLSISESPSSLLTRNYNFYRFRRYNYSRVVDGSFAKTLAAAAKVPVEVAKRMENSQMVQDKGDTLLVSDKAKAASPLFSFVRTSYSPTQKQKFAPCFSENEAYNIRLVEEGARAYKGFASAMGSFPNLFAHDTRLGKKKISNHLGKLLYSVTAIHRWWESIENTEELPDIVEDQTSAEPINSSALDGVALSVMGTESKYKAHPEEVVRDLALLAEPLGIAPSVAFFRQGTTAQRSIYTLLGIKPTPIPSPLTRKERETQLRRIRDIALQAGKLPQDALKTFYALLVAYYALGGKEAARYADEVANELRSLSALLQGGERGYGGTGEVVFKTYNPVLFQLVRQNWQTDFRLAEHKDLIEEVDRVGVMGAATQMVYQAELQGLPVQEYLFEEFTRASRVGKKQMERAKSGAYRNVLLFWPFGDNRAELFGKAQSFVEHPATYIRNLKGFLSEGVSRLLRSPRATDAQMDWVTKEKTPIARSSLAKATDEQKRLKSLLRAIDKRISALER